MIIDKYTKFVLTVIALSLLVIAFKDSSIISPAYAQLDSSDYSMFSNGLNEIARAINRIDLVCN
jgi:hypothetical protein